MSHWYEPKLKDLHYSLDGKDLSILLGNDESGNIYASVPIADIKKFLKTPPPKREYPKETRWTPKKK